MFWPDTGTGVDVQPERKAVQSAVRKFFTEGGVGVPPTVPGGDWFNQITNELLNVLAAAGIQPDKASDTQLLQAIQTLSAVSQLSSQIDGVRTLLKRGISAARPETESTSRLAVYAAFEAARKINTDGGITVWEPDGTGSYGAAWTRDMAMAMEGFPEYFSADEIEAVLTYWLAKSNFTTYEVPDRIGHSGIVYWRPGQSEDWGSRAPIDGNIFVMQMAWLHYQSTGNASLYNSNKTALKNLIELGVSYNPTSGCVNISNSSPYVGFGFYDSAILTGDVLFPSVLAMRAYQMAADMEMVLGNSGEAKRLLDRADTIKAGINSTFLVRRAGAGAELGDNYSARRVAYYTVATTKGANQIDLWGSAFAVFAGVPSDVDALAIAEYFNYITTVNNNNMVSGGLRHVEMSTDYNPGVSVFQSFWTAPLPYGEYQNGGYWPTPLPWVLYAISLVQPRTSRNHYDSFVSFQSTHGIKQPAEWWKANGTLSGPGKYLTSARALLNMGERLVAPAAGGSGGDIVSNLAHAEVTINASTTLTAAAFGKMHVCKGTSANYTVVLPTAVGNAGKIIGFRMADYATLSKLVTIDGAGSEMLDGQAIRIMWADESAIIMSDGVGWKKISGRVINFCSRAHLSSNQTLPAAALTKVTLNALSFGFSAAHGVFDAVNNRFVIPRQATWSFQGGVNFTVGSAGNSIIAQLNKNGSNLQQLASAQQTSSNNLTLTGAGTFALLQNDTLDLNAFSISANTIGGVEYGSFLSAFEVYSW